MKIMKKEAWENIVGVTINNLEEYDSSKCRNGGCYAFYTNFRRISEDTFEVSYGTSSDFEYCDVCGSFHRYDEERCGEPATISAEDLLEIINNFEETDDHYLEYTKEWQNTGMKHQPIHRWVTFDPNSTSGDAHILGVDSWDRTRQYTVYDNCVKVCKLNNQRVECFSYYPHEEDYLNKDVMIHAFYSHCEEIFSSNTYTDVYIDEVAENMMKMSEKYNLGWVMEKGYCHEEYSDFYRIYSKEFAKKCYVGKDVLFCLTAESLVELLAEDNHLYCDFKKHEVAMIEPDGCIDEYVAYVVERLEEHTSFTPAQLSLIKCKIAELDGIMAEIDADWNKRGITDATAEPEWDFYESRLMLRAELGLGI